MYSQLLWVSPEQRPVGPGGAGPLPEGWEECITEDGRTYYVDHINETTSWERPAAAAPAAAPQFSIPTASVYPQQHVETGGGGADLSSLTPDEQLRRALELSSMEVRLKKESTQTVFIGLTVDRDFVAVSRTMQPALHQQMLL